MWDKVEVTALRWALAWGWFQKNLKSPTQQAKKKKNVFTEEINMFTA